MTVCLPTFSTHPDEKRDIEPAIQTYFKNAGVEIHVIDGLFDLLVVSPVDRFDSYLEVKVRLKNHSKSCPISPAQWSFLKAHAACSSMESNLRFLIYDHHSKKYAIATASQLAGGIQPKTPKTTSYISSACLASLPWADECVTGASLMAWVRR